MEAILTDNDLGFDPEALREKYRIERARRLRADGTAQYIHAPAPYLDDPYADPNFRRPPIVETVEVLIIGGGYGGLLTAARLKQAGVEDIRIVERAAEFSGSWYWNRYPGVGCDTESYIYMPLLEETGYVPTTKYAKGPELYEHGRRIGRHFDLYRRTLFQTAVVEARWDEAADRWTVKTSRGDVLSARFLVLATGVAFGAPKLPGVPGVDSFKGHTFHTVSWDYAYTGGDTTGGLTRLADKRVGIIGTGATAVQAIPHLGEWAKDLYVFQRTPSSVDVRADRPTDPAWATSLQPGWHKARMDNFTTVITGGNFEVDLVNDGWTELLSNIVLAARLRQKAGEVVEDPEKLVQLADFQKMERVRARIDAIVKDKATAEALKPWYNQLCKRPCFHDEYLDTFNRPNVHLVDTAGRGVERITESGVVANGREYPLDCLIFATGFDAGWNPLSGTGFDLHGRGGQSLNDRWKDGVLTLHGVLSHGFPNAFIMTLIQSGVTPNFQHMLDVKAQHTAFMIAEARARGIKAMEPTVDAERAWVDGIVESTKARRPFLAECTPGYYNNEGAQFDVRTARNNQYWRGPVAYIKVLDRWRQDGSLPGLELTR